MPGPRNSHKQRLCRSLLLLASSACADASERATFEAGATRVPTLLISELVADLDDGDSTELVLPYWVESRAGGGYWIADRSDRDVKSYDGSGRRSGTIGQVGYGAGHFSSLASIFSISRVVGAFDFERSEVAFFEFDGSLVDTLPFGDSDSGRPTKVRAVNDSLLLVQYHPVDRPRRKMLKTVDLNGTTVAEFLDPDRAFGSNVVARSYSSVQADTYDGCVFAAYSTSDSIWAFDPSGKLIAAGVLDEENRWGTIEERFPVAVPDSGTRLSLPSGFLLIKTLVALPGCAVAIQVGQFRAEEETYNVHLAPGTVHVYSAMNGLFRGTARIDIEGGLVGRDHDGSPLYVVPSVTGMAGNHSLHRIRVVYSNHQ